VLGTGRGGRLFYGAPAKADEVEHEQDDPDQPDRDPNPGDEEQHQDPDDDKGKSGSDHTSRTPCLRARIRWPPARLRYPRGVPEAPARDRSSSKTDKAIAQLAGLLGAARSAVALTGAGISTESGIPDFRGPDGLWRDQTLEELAHLDTFEREPQLTWEFYRLRLQGMEDKEPNRGHLALASLERQGLLKAVITQNIDGLHARAGSDPVEVHGTLRKAECLACRIRVPMETALAAVGPDGVPLCERCGGPLKPGITLFGELLPEEAIDRAYQLVAASDLLLVCGSSLMVWPVSSFPRMVKAQGGQLAILNRGVTDFDADADVRLDGALGELLPALAAALA
jgi:NAD-dependent deacetylase